MAVLSLASLAACVSLFGFAALAKFLDRDVRPLDRAVAALEAVVAGAVALPVSRTGGLVAAIALSMIFVLYTVLRREKPCRCFGIRLVSQSFAGRLLRSTFALASSAVALAGDAAVGSTTSRPITAVTLGLAATLAITVLPAFALNAASTPSSLRSETSLE